MAVTLSTTAATPLLGTPLLPVTWTSLYFPSPIGEVVVTPVALRVSSTRRGVSAV